MSRTPEWTAEKKEKFLKILPLQNTIGAACAATGISRRAVNHWRSVDPEFSEAYEEAIQHVVRKHEFTLDKAAASDPKWAHVLLKNIDPDNWVDKQEVKVETTEPHNAYSGEKEKWQNDQARNEERTDDE